MRRNFLMLKKSLPLAELIMHRRSREDPGREPSFDRADRRTAGDLVAANFTRAKESLRIIEEIMKINDLSSSRLAKEIRFQVYDLEKTVLGIQRRRFNPRFCVIIDERYSGEINLKKAVPVLIKNGATMIQLRIKDKPDRTFLRWARIIRRSIEDPCVKFIVNDRPDIAMLAGADGVHVGQKDLPVREVRGMLGEGFIIGASVHDLEEARHAIADGADYLGIGAVFRTTTKRDAVVCGVKRLRALCRLVNIPVIGIGGINDANFHAVLNAGAAGIAVSSFIFEGDLERNVRALTRIHK
jgi:thiamine-phosphate pyrophosphorylase